MKLKQKFIKHSLQNPVHRHVAAPVLQKKPVITSYSIHYTKLYDTDLKLPVVHDNFFNLNLPENNWDVATMWDVLEHINEPEKAVQKVFSMLKPGGYFVLQVPQIDSKVAKIV